MVIPKSTNEYLKFGFVIFTVLVSINFWSCQIIGENIHRLLELFVLGSLLCITLYYNYIFRRKLTFKYNVLFFILLPILSGYGALMFHDQPLKLSFTLTRYVFFWLFYFVLHLFQVPVEKIVKLMIFVGVVWVLITLVQQATYPLAYFYTRMADEHYSIYRAGVYRFMIYGHQYGAFCLSFFFYQYLIKKKNVNLLFVGLALIGFYYFGTRQYMISAFACVLIASLMVKGRAQLQAVTIFLIALPIVAMFADQLFTKYIELTNEQWEYGDDQRKLTATFFLFEYWPHWFAKIIGNGPNHMNSAYGAEMEYLRSRYHYYRSDVGLIGAFNAYGIFHVINIIMVNLKTLRRKYFTYETRYLQLASLYSIIILVGTEYYATKDGMAFFCLLFYLIDKSYEQKKQMSETKLRSYDVPVPSLA